MLCSGLFNVQKLVAENFGYIENDEKGLIKDNNTHCCMLCGKKQDKGFLKAKSRISVKSNNSYTYANTKSDFICSYCDYTMKVYRKVDLSKKLNKTLEVEIEKLKDENVLIKAFEKLSSNFEEKIKLMDKVTDIQKRKIEDFRKIVDSGIKKEDVKHLLALIFDYEVLTQFVSDLGLKDLATSYSNLSDIADFVLHHDGKIELIHTLRGDKDNSLYSILKNPPKTPFVVSVKDSNGKSVVYNAHLLEETIDENYIIVNFGVEKYVVDRFKVFEALDEAEKIYAMHRSSKQKISDDVLFNSTQTIEYSEWFTQKLRENKAFMQDYISFVNKYDKSTRIVAKIIMATYREKLKENN